MLYSGLDVWQYLQNCKKPIVLYGMGNGADKIISVMERFGLCPADFFASDGFVRGHSFHGKRVLSFSEVREKYDDFVIVLSFASALPEMLERFDQLDRDFDLVAPDVPVCGGELFDSAYFARHRAELEETYQMLEDTRSREIFENVVSYKLSGRLRYLQMAQCTDEEEDALLCPQRFTSYADLGAYNGDTVRRQLKKSPQLKRAVAMEPDPRNFKKLENFCAGVPQVEFSLSQAAAWDTDGAWNFSADGSRSATAEEAAFSLGKNIKKRPVQTACLDTLLAGACVDYIKYDVEGSEAKALRGSAQTIRQHHPALLVSLYHRTEDLIELPRLIREIDPTYRLYIRRFPYVPAWDLNLYCI